MKIPIIRIGNSQGIRLPKTILDQCGIAESVELSVLGNYITLTPSSTSRKGWSEAFAVMSNDDDQVIDDADDIANDWDETDWQW